MLLYLCAGGPAPLPGRHLANGAPPTLLPAARAALLSDGLAAISKLQKGGGNNGGDAAAAAAAAALRQPLRASRAAANARGATDLTPAQLREFDACLYSGGGGERAQPSSPAALSTGAGAATGSYSGASATVSSEARLATLLQQLAADGVPIGGLYGLAELYSGVHIATEGDWQGA